MTWRFPGCVEGVARSLSSLISSSAVSVYLAADLTIFSATCFFVLIQILASEKSKLELNAPIIPRKPDCRKVPPPQFPDNGILARRELVGDFDRVVTALDVFFPVLLSFSHSGTKVSKIRMSKTLEISGPQLERADKHPNHEPRVCLAAKRRFLALILLGVVKALSKILY